MIEVMAKKKPPTSGPKKRYPSRDNYKSLSLSKELYEGLQAYAESRSTEDDKKSVSWAARAIVRKFLSEQGILPPKPKG